LDPLNLPTQQQLTCPLTGQIMKFLLQVYCPVDSNPVEAFHRAVFVFLSPKGSDLAQPGAVRAFRCQLPRSNPFYPDQPAPSSQATPTPLPQQQQQLALGRDPWQVAAREQQQGAAAAAGPGVFSEQELVVDPEPEEGDEDGAAGGVESEVQR
jgi:pre-rRNA-processing protein TSR4